MNAPMCNYSENFWISLSWSPVITIILNVTTSLRDSNLCGHPLHACNTSSRLISILIAETLLLWLLSAMNSTGLLRKDSSHSLSPSASSLCSLWEDRKTLSHHFFLPSSFLPLFLFPLPPIPFSLPPSFLPSLSLFICTTCTHTHWTTTYSAVLTISSVNLFRGLGKPAHPTRAESDIHSNPSLS